MFKVTPPALERLAERLDRDSAEPGIALRLTRNEGRWRLGQDRRRPGDLAFAHDGREVLLLDAAGAMAADELTLELRRTADGTRLRMRRRPS